MEINLPNGLLLLWGLLLLAPLFLSSLSARRQNQDALPNAANVTVLNRTLAGCYASTTLASHDPEALAAWLHRHGYVLASNTLPVITE